MTCAIIKSATSFFLLVVDCRSKQSLIKKFNVGNNSKGINYGIGKSASVPIGDTNKFQLEQSGRVAEASGRDERG